MKDPSCVTWSPSEILVYSLFKEELLSLGMLPICIPSFGDNHISKMNVGGLQPLLCCPAAKLFQSFTCLGLTHLRPSVVRFRMVSRTKCPNNFPWKDVWQGSENCSADMTCADKLRRTALGFPVVPDVKILAGKVSQALGHWARCHTTSKTKTSLQHPLLHHVALFKV